jgi:hypothetical protein
MIHEDQDIVRGLGFVTMYSAWLEQDVDDILEILSPVSPFEQKIQRMRIGQKIKYTATQLEQLLNNETIVELPNILRNSIELFERRNELIHGRIFAGHDKTAYLQSGRPNVPTRVVSAAEIYQLAKDFFNYRGHLIAAQVIRLPTVVAAHALTTRRKH